MAKHDELIVEERDDGRWKEIKPHGERASAIAANKTQAIRRAKQIAPEGDIKN